MTARLYYDDAYLTTFDAQVVDSAGTPLRVYLDRSAFYPTSGGQPYDTGVIGGVEVIEVIDEEERVAHVVAAPIPPGPAACRVDWARRFDHMQQHSGQHILSAVLAGAHGVQTVSFHLGEESSTIDVEAASLDAALLAGVERRVNEAIWENRPVSVLSEDSASAQGLRKASGREGTLRIVSIESLDRSACGGTHVRHTGEVGLLLIRKLDKIRGIVRIEFLCGARALRRALADYHLLGQAARVLSASIDELPALVAAQAARLADAEKQRRRLAIELARLRGSELYRNTPPEESGLRSHVRRLPKGALDDELRAEAQSFTAHPKALFLAVLEEPPSLLLAVSGDGPLQAGAALKKALAAGCGRGGGNAQLAQGSLPGTDELDRAVRAIMEELRRG